MGDLNYSITHYLYVGKDVSEYFVDGWLELSDSSL